MFQTHLLLLSYWQTSDKNFFCGRLHYLLPSRYRIVSFVARKPFDLNSEITIWWHSTSADTSLGHLWVEILIARPQNLQFYPLCFHFDFRISDERLANPSYALFLLAHHSLTWVYTFPYAYALIILLHYINLHISSLRALICISLSTYVYWICW